MSKKHKHKSPCPICNPYRYMAVLDAQVYLQAADVNNRADLRGYIV
jgi:hypothetical protein